MLFNGKYYNKPGHLGMTRSELKEALAGGGGLYIVTIDYNSEDELFADKTYAEIQAAYESGKKIVFYTMDSRNICTSLEPTPAGILIQDTAIMPGDSFIDIAITTYVIKPDETIEATSSIGRVSATFN